MKITKKQLKQLTGKCNPQIMRDCGVERFVEIGIREGRSFKSHIKGVSKLAVAVDIWKDTNNPAQNDADYPQEVLDNQYKNFKRDMSNIKSPEIKIIRDFSSEASKQFEDEFFDWVFIDADHSYEGCRIDLYSWFPKLKSGGVFSGHDYMFKDVYWNGVRCGVKEAVDEFVENFELDLFVYDKSSNPSWYLIK